MTKKTSSLSESPLSIARARVAELEAAIRKHKVNFPDEALHGEIELWSHIGEGDVPPNYQE